MVDYEDDSLWRCMDCECRFPKGGTNLKAHEISFTGGDEKKDWEGERAGYSRQAEADDEKLEGEDEEALGLLGEPDEDW